MRLKCLQLNLENTKILKHPNKLMGNFFQQKVINTVGPTINNLWQIIENDKIASALKYTKKTTK